MAPGSGSEWKGTRRFAQIKLVYDFYDEAGQMLFGQPFLNRRWHEHRRVSIDRPEYR